MTANYALIGNAMIQSKSEIAMSEFFELSSNGLERDEGIRQLITNLQQQIRQLVTDRDRYVSFLNETRKQLDVTAEENKLLQDEIINLNERLSSMESINHAHNDLANALQTSRENISATIRRANELLIEKEIMEQDRNDWRRRAEIVESDERQYREAWQSTALRNSEMLNEIRALWKVYLPDWTPASAIKSNTLNPAWRPVAERLAAMDEILASMAINDADKTMHQRFSLEPPGFIPELIMTPISDQLSTVTITVNPPDDTQ